MSNYETNANRKRKCEDEFVRSIQDLFESNKDLLVYNEKLIESNDIMIKKFNNLISGYEHFNEAIKELIKHNSGEYSELIIKHQDSMKKYVKQISYGKELIQTHTELIQNNQILITKNELLIEEMIK
jgi:hypothetical protein